jgi:hypothetical protein
MILSLLYLCRLQARVNLLTLWVKKFVCVLSGDIKTDWWKSCSCAISRLKINTVASVILKRSRTCFGKLFHWVLIRINYKKTRLARGNTTPCGIALIVEDLLTQAEKIPEPLSHPYTRATQSHVSAGQSLKPVLWRLERQGDFFNQSRNSLPEGIELGTSRVATRSFNHYVASPFVIRINY